MYLEIPRHLQATFVRQFEDKRDPQIHETGSYMHGRRGGKGGGGGGLKIF